MPEPVITSSVARAPSSRPTKNRRVGPRVRSDATRSLISLLGRRPREWLFLGEAVGRLIAAKFRIGTIPFRDSAAHLGQQHAETLLPLPAPGRELAQSVSWAVQAAARWLPFGFNCLPQAMAAQRMLSRRGVDTTLYLGVELKEQAALGAHAWLRAGGMIVTGKAARPGYTPVATFALLTPVPRRLDRLLCIGLAFAATLLLALASLLPESPLQNEAGWVIPYASQGTLHFIGSNDFLCNLVGFACFNTAILALLYGFKRAPWPHRLRFLAWVGSAIVTLELLQILLPGRHFDPLDLVAAALALAATTWPWTSMARR